MRNSNPCSRTELLKWLNDTLSLSYASIEECSNGAAFCQLMDCIYPGSVNFRKVLWTADDEITKLANYKILEEGFVKKNITRQIPVQILIKGRFQACFEMLQWFKSYYDQHQPSGKYDGAARRTEVTKKKAYFRGSNATFNMRNTSRSVVQSTSTSKKRPSQLQLGSISKRFEMTESSLTTRIKKSTPNTSKQNLELKKILKNLNDNMEAATDQKDELLKERNFYIKKLLKIEALCNNHPNEDFKDDILSIIYKEDKEKGFFSPDELEI